MSIFCWQIAVVFMLVSLWAARRTMNKYEHTISILSDTIVYNHSLIEQYNKQAEDINKVIEQYKREYNEALNIIDSMSQHSNKPQLSNMIKKEKLN